MPERLCTIEGCQKKHYARWWCRLHYRHVVEGLNKVPIVTPQSCASCGSPLRTTARSSGYCRTCYYKSWAAKNKGKLEEYQRQYNQENRERNAVVRKAWQDSNKDWINKYYGKKRKDVQYRLAHNLRSRLHDALRGKVKTGSSVADLGCTISELKEHLERQFAPWMTWNNYGTEWTVDHIEPLCAFNLENRDELLKACNYKNLRPLGNYEQFSKATADKKKRAIIDKDKESCRVLPALWSPQ